MIKEVLKFACCHPELVSESLRQTQNLYDEMPKQVRHDKRNQLVKEVKNEFKSPENSNF